jgi:pilus assembly protein CpaC
MFGSVLLVAALALAPGDANVGNANALTVVVGKSVSIDSARSISRVALANENVAECLAITPRELLVSGKVPGETSLVVWQDNGTRRSYDITVVPSPSRLNAVQKQVAQEFPNVDIRISMDNDIAFVRGTVKDTVSADRVIAIASTLGKTVNLLRVTVPPEEPQILLNVRFATVSHTVSKDLALSLASAAGNQSTAAGTGQILSPDGGKTFSLSQAINLFLFRKDINLMAAIQALESKRLLEILAEPNLLVINGTQADFVAGGEFPYPVVQPGANGTSVTIAFKEYGIRLGFLPVITPRGTIRLQVAPEVSALDYTNSVTVAGTVVPGTSTRRVQTEVELESGQSFVIAGLLDRETTETLSRVPGLASIPLLGKLFQSQSLSRHDTELLVLITPEIVRPIPAGQPTPVLAGPPARWEVGGPPPRQPGIDKTGPAPTRPPLESLPVEVLQPPPEKKTDPAPQPRLNVPERSERPGASAGSDGRSAPACVRYLPFFCFA